MSAEAGRRSSEVGIRPEDGADSFVVSGPLTFDSTPSVWREGVELLEGRASITLDLKEVTRSDSAGLALLIEWMREARRGGVEIHFRNIPEQMLSIARISRLDHLLPGS